MRIKWIEISLLTTSFLLVGCEKARVDEQVRELCAKDGGIKVFETVALPAQKFDKYGFIDFYRPTQGRNALGPDYFYESEVRELRQGDPTLRRYHFRVIRSSDAKVLGESIGYSRVGGDIAIPLPIHESSFACPPYDQVGDVPLLRKVFVQMGQGEEK